MSIDSDLTSDREPPVAGDIVLRGVHVSVCEESCDRVGGARDERSWAVSRNGSAGQIALPASFGVAPRDPSRPGRVEILVEALRRSEPGAADGVLFRTRRLVSFVPERSSDVSIFLSAGCIGRECPPGSVCGDEGACVPFGDLDAGMLDAAPAEDAGHDASATEDAGPRDAGLDASDRPDALTDARVVPDAAVPDGGLGCGPTLGPPTVPRATSELGLSGTSGLSAVARASDGSLLVAGYSRGAFRWAGVDHAEAAYFVSRMRSDGSAAYWTTLFTYDTARSSAFSGIARVVEVGDRVYVAGQAVEAWSSGTVSLPEVVPGTPTDSRRLTPRLIGLDAATGAALWGHTFKLVGSTDLAAGLAADGSGAWLTTRAFGGASSASYLVDGVDRVADRGTDAAYAHLVHVDAAGAIASIHGISGTFVADMDVALHEGDVVLAVYGGTPLVGFDEAIPDGELAIVRLDAAGHVRWGAAVDCTTGAWSPMGARLSIGGGRAWVAWAARSTSVACAGLTVRGSGGTSRALTRTDTSRAWFGAVSIDACGGRADGTSRWLGAAGSSSFFNIQSVSASAEGVAIGGYLSAGGADLGLGTIAGRDSGTMGGDGFVVLASHEGTPVLTWITGGSAAGSAGPDDFVDQVLLRPGALEVVGSWSGPQDRDGVTIPEGGRLLELTLP
ncbi:MAG: hypothetical protein K1X94_11090 [Sandaracinaceae bacterium]|nr:hypothetical protein [Sandaracinaceae bacterium]